MDHVVRSSLPQDLTLWGMIQSADAVVKTVMICLALASVVTWTVALAKSFELFAVKRALRRGIIVLERAASLRVAKQVAATGVVEPFLEAVAREAELTGQASGGLKERIASRLGRLEAAAGRRIARGTGVLATIAATAPFVGLFGTVWGVMNSFIGISKAQTTNLAVVAPGIAEALLTTAAGLVAAVPAVIIYNALARAIGGYRGLVRDVSSAVQRLVSRDLDCACAAEPLIEPCFPPAAPAARDRSLASH